MTHIRTRFAPSPTGYLHVGGIRTALFAWLIARKHGGEFILRIEDTDQAREVAGSADHIMESLQWLGLQWDEGPFYQSQRLDIYKKWAQKLIESGRAYADPYTPEEVQAFREQAQKDKKPFLYRNHRPENPPAWDGTQPLRFKVDIDQVPWSDSEGMYWNDAVMGTMYYQEANLDDFILIKSDGFPTYNFAHIVDDIEMGITHVIRGQEFLPSIPNYLNLYKALYKDNAQDELRDLIPDFATVPPIMNEQGNKKLSKRDGAKDILQYRSEGYLPEAMVNFLASLGWNDGTEQEVFSIQELIEKFTLERVQRSGARFDERRLLWLNGAHIREHKVDSLYEKVEAYWPESASAHSSDYKKAVLALTQERLKYFAELPTLTRFFFEELPINPELISTHKQLKKYDSSTLKSLLETSKEALEASDFTSVESLQTALNELLEKTGEKPAVLLSLIRIALTQSPASPGLADTLHVLGKDISLSRIHNQSIVL